MGAGRSCSRSRAEVVFVPPPQHPCSHRFQQGQRKESSKNMTSVSAEIQLNKAENAWKPGVKAARGHSHIAHHRHRGEAEGLIDLVFKKAIYEPTFSETYANMCHLLKGHGRCQLRRGTGSWSWEKELTLPPGGTITIPCHYDLKYIQHKKYWCYHARAAYNFCKILAYANNTEDKVTVTDYPAQSLFTVTTRDLHSGDTGSYWCVVEIEGILSRDVDEQMFITVKADPDLSVKESSVSGQEGGNISVQCLYSAGYQKEQKQWCRSKDSRCYTVGRTNTAQGSAVQISDDGRRSFRVEMSELQKSDAGWYWCKTGKLQILVHLSISDASPDVTTFPGTERSSISEITRGFTAVTVNGRTEGSDSNDMTVWTSVATVCLGMLFFLVSVLVCVVRKNYNRTQMESTERINSAAVQASSITEEPVTYSTVISKKKKPSSASDPENDVTNSSVQHTLSPAVGDDGVIYSSVVHKYSESVRTLKKLAVRRGGSLSVPCFYDKQHKLNRKYWCRGYYWSSCGIEAHTDQRTKTTSVTDHPTQNMFTVELNSLQDSDSGYYWCAVEIGGIGTPDDRDYVDLTVSADPAVWVENSRVSGQEGGSVSVQCFYSAEYKNEEKKWCRFKDWSCYPNSAVKISDDGRRSFRVEMSGLQKSDAGWYWCSAGDVAVTVHLTVTERPTTTTAATTDTTTQATSTMTVERSTSAHRNTKGTVNPRNSLETAVTSTTEKSEQAPTTPPAETMHSRHGKSTELVEFCTTNP
ncbi:polymeric immunoglobulin receptor-like [Salminus brasiliensis]|uniref:polymeric immunoglobulin receptor-like n=1 Tax=Salminus brasiliensis TaxID=930266 RepID=UPI003B833DFA